MEHNPESPTVTDPFASMPTRSPTQVLAARVKELRKSRGWSAQRLADEMTRVGIKWERMVVTKLETGRRQSISVDEWLALAYVLDVAPIHLIVPFTDAHPFEYAVTPTLQTQGSGVRAWIRGQSPIGDQDPRKYFAEVPPVEWSPPAWSHDQIEQIGEQMEKRRGDAS